jgi:hypothetical protein
MTDLGLKAKSTFSGRFVTSGENLFLGVLVFGL